MQNMDRISEFVAEKVNIELLKVNKLVYPQNLLDFFLILKHFLYLNDEVVEILGDLLPI
jgi:hypothetical protein